MLQLAGAAWDNSEVPSRQHSGSASCQICEKDSLMPENINGLLFGMHVLTLSGCSVRVLLPSMWLANWRAQNIGQPTGLRDLTEGSVSVLQLAGAAVHKAELSQRPFGRSGTLKRHSHIWFRKMHLE